MMTGLDLVPVHYRGAAPAITDMIAGRVQVMFDVVISSLSYIKSGQLRALGVTTADEQKVLPGVPTVKTFVPGFEAAGWQGVCAPAKTPAAIIDRLNKEINESLRDPDLVANLAKLGGVPDIGPPAAFGKFIASETEKWGKVVRKAGLKAG
jgi:tripartite-type tricarboxylate transporter receptor subunit TctC